jgi:hypothetical protein
MNIEYIPLGLVNRVISRSISYNPIFYTISRNIANFTLMRAIFKILIPAAGFLLYSLSSSAQCQILHRVSPDGSMQYYMEPVNFYWTSAKSLKGCIVTDKENYFLELQPIPFPEKPAGHKLKKDLALKLSDGKTYMLKHLDTRYSEKDTLMEMLYLIDNKDIENILNIEVTEVSIDMMGIEGVRTYEFKLHKSALQEQLACFLKDDEKKKK